MCLLCSQKAIRTRDKIKAHNRDPLSDSLKATALARQFVRMVKGVRLP